MEVPISLLGKTESKLKTNILEIFKSVQGEGKYVGMSQVFVRFFACNIHCVWCDTPASIGDTARHYQEMDTDELFARIRDLWSGCQAVSLTGGEPLLQTDRIRELLPQLNQAAMPVHLETNGILHEELKTVIDGIETIAMDIKLPSSTQCAPFWQEHERFLKTALQKDVFIKTVISNDTEEGDIVKTVDLISRVAPDVLLILQPNTYEIKNGVLAKCLNFQDYCLRHLSQVRVVPQMHKFLKLR